MTYIMVILSVPLSFPMSYMGVVIGGGKAFGGTFTIFLHGLHHMIHEEFYTFNMYYLIASAALYVLALIQISIGKRFSSKFLNHLIHFNVLRINTEVLQGIL